MSLSWVQTTNPDHKPEPRYDPDSYIPLVTEADKIAACAESGGLWTRPLFQDFAAVPAVCLTGMCSSCASWLPGYWATTQSYWQACLQSFEVDFDPTLRF